MSTVEQRIWHCDICGFEWVKTPGVRPEQCPSRKCRSRKWNINGGVELNEEKGISARDGNSAAARVELGDTGGDQIDSRDARYPRPSLGGAGGEAENRLGEENKAVTVTLGWEAGKMPAGAAIKLACPQCGALGGVHQKNCKAGW